MRPLREWLRRGELLDISWTLRERRRNDIRHTLIIADWQYWIDDISHYFWGHGADSRREERAIELATRWEWDFLTCTHTPTLPRREISADYYTLRHVSVRQRGEPSEPYAAGGRRAATLLQPMISHITSSRAPHTKRCAEPLLRFEATQPLASHEMTSVRRPWARRRRLKTLPTLRRRGLRGLRKWVNSHYERDLRLRVRHYAIRAATTPWASHDIGWWQPFTPICEPRAAVAAAIAGPGHGEPPWCHNTPPDYDEAVIRQPWCTRHNTQNNITTHTFISE